MNFIHPFNNTGLKAGAKEIFQYFSKGIFLILNSHVIYMLMLIK